VRAGHRAERENQRQESSPGRHSVRKQGERLIAASQSLGHDARADHGRQ
jgi:hypothetical protein